MVGFLVVGWVQERMSILRWLLFLLFVLIPLDLIYCKLQESLLTMLHGLNQPWHIVQCRYFASVSASTPFATSAQRASVPHPLRAIHGMLFFPRA